MEKSAKIRIIVGIVLFVLGAVLLVGYGYSQRHKYKETLLAQTNQIADLKNKIDVLSNKQTAQSAKLQYAATGLQSERKQRDDELAETFLRKCLTWHSGAEYDSMRESLIREYKLDSNGSFVSLFLPPNVKSDDGAYNYIDTHHANSMYEDMESYVSEIRTDGYSYLTYVKWSASDISGNEASSVCVFLYDVTADSVLTNLNAYTIADI